MRRCIKNFNFKLDYNEIDRIIEEEEGGGPPPAEVEEVKQEKVATPKETAKKPTTTQARQQRKQWNQDNSPKAKKAGVRVQRNINSALQTSSNDPIL